MPTPSIFFGRIVWARVADARDGGALKRRPVVVIRPPTATDPTFDWVGCSTQPPRPEDKRYFVQLSSGGPPHGHRYTKFKEPSYCYAYWTGTMHPDDIENPETDVRGQVHEAQMIEVVEAFERAKADATVG